MLPRLPVGTYDVLVRGDEFVGVAQLRVEGRKATTTVHLQRGATVRLPLGAIPPRTRLFYAMGSTDPSELNLGAAKEGVLTLPRLLPGRCDLIVAPDGGRRRQLTLTLKDGETRTVDLDDPALSWR